MNLDTTCLEFGGRSSHKDKDTYVTTTDRQLERLGKVIHTLDGAALKKTEVKVLGN